MGRLTERLLRFRDSVEARVWGRVGTGRLLVMGAEAMAVEEAEVVMVQRRTGGARGREGGRNALIPSCLI